MKLKQRLKKFADRQFAKAGYRPDQYWLNLLKTEQLYPIDYVEPQDIFVAGYPKSGNTWMQHLMAGILYGIDTKYLPDKLTQEIVPNRHNKKYYRRFGQICVFKTHHLPKPHYRRVIHLVRDGRDAVASYYAMMRNLNEPFSLEEIIIEGRGLFPCKWHEHTKQWLENPYDAEVLRVRYEDLLQNPLYELTRICRFVRVERQSDELERVIEGCSFQEMKRKEREFGHYNPRWPRNKSFFRRGKIGSHREEIPEPFIDFFEKEACEYLTFLEYISSVHKIE